MLKAFSIAVFGLAPTILGAGGAWAAGKTIDMGYVDPTTIQRACREAGTVPYSSGTVYGCRKRGVSIQCSSETCIATGSDLAPITGDSPDAIFDALKQRAGNRIRPLDTRIEPATRPTQ